MKYQSFLIKYAEIGLKGKNRYVFEDALVSNIKHALKDTGYSDIYKEQERIYVDFEKEYDYDDVISKLKKVFGIYTICPIHKVDFTTDYNTLKNFVISYIKEIYNDTKSTFKVKTRRINKVFPMHSDDINKELGHDILENFPNLTVDVHTPNIMLFVEIRKHINIYSEKIYGAGGLPIGTGGKAMLLLSGGIDSPVAGYMISKRGVEIHAIYFDAPPYTSDRAKQKVIDLANIISKYMGKLTLHIINFTEIQLKIYELCPHDELTIIMRRIMMKISEKIALDENCEGLITGESIGQVASQTLPSLRATNDAVSLPVFRPLIGFDKDEIIEIAKKIGTFDTSIQPFEDCCTIFVAKHPVTKPHIDKIKKSELKLTDIDTWIDTAIATKKIISI